ncbi:Nucleolar transcription factor 1-B [Sarcoptes scabiei]|nr:Nucleolar transcription factor 1-B [Sarcoptes scabiei]
MNHTVIDSDFNSTTTFLDHFFGTGTKSSARNNVHHSKKLTVNNSDLLWIIVIALSGVLLMSILMILFIYYWQVLRYQSSSPMQRSFNANRNTKSYRHLFANKITKTSKMKLMIDNKINDEKIPKNGNLLIKSEQIKQQWKTRHLSNT